MVQKRGKRNKWDIKPQLREVQVLLGVGVKNRFWGVGSGQIDRTSDHHRDIKDRKVQIPVCGFVCEKLSKID